MLIDDIRPNGALDAAIHIRFRADTGVHYADGEWVCDGKAIPAYSSSVDAMITLYEDVLPGWLYRFCKCSVTDDVWLMPDYCDPKYAQKFMDLYGEQPQDPLEEGPGLDISTAPSGHVALSMVTCLLAVVEGIRNERRPYGDGRELHKLNKLAQEDPSAAEHYGLNLG